MCSESQYVLCNRCLCICVHCMHAFVFIYACTQGQVSFKNIFFIYYIKKNMLTHFSFKFIAITRGPQLPFTDPFIHWSLGSNVLNQLFSWSHQMGSDRPKFQKCSEQHVTRFIASRGDWEMHFSKYPTTRHPNNAKWYPRLLDDTVEPGTHVRERNAHTICNT